MLFGEAAAEEPPADGLTLHALGKRHLTTLPAEVQVKKLIVPVFGLLLAACTYQFAPTGSENSKRPDFNAPPPSTATASIDLPSADDGGSGPGVPGGDMGGGPPSPSPGDDGSDGGMPAFPDMPGGG